VATTNLPAYESGIDRAHRRASSLGTGETKDCAVI